MHKTVDGGGVTWNRGIEWVTREVRLQEPEIDDRDLLIGLGPVERPGIWARFGSDQARPKGCLSPTRNLNGLCYKT